MRAMLAVSMAALLAAGGCASVDTMRALQAGPPPPQGMIRFGSEHHYRDAIALEWIGGVSQRSYLFAEPNQRVIRPIVRRALADAGLEAGTNVRARYGLRVLVAEAHGPSVGATFNSDLAATYMLVDRLSGEEIWRRDIHTPGVGYFLAFNEHDWQTAWFIDPILAVYNVGNPFNFFPFASDSAADRARRQGVHGGYSRAEVERFGPERAARANYAATATNAAAFLVAFAADHGIEMMPILPCWGSPEVEARKRAIMEAGGNFATDNCMVSR